MTEALFQFTDLTAEERHEVDQFLLPTTAEIAGIIGPDWVEPRSLRAKTLIRRLLGLVENERVSPPHDPQDCTVSEPRGTCGDCGRPDNETIDFLVSTTIWNYVMAGQKTTTYTIRPGLFDKRLYPRVEGVGGVVCLECFDKRARVAGVSYHQSLVVFGLDCWMGADTEPQMPL